MKKLLIILSLILFSISLCACTKKETRTVIKFASWGSKSEVDIIVPLLEDFEKQNPDIKIEFMHIPQNYFQKIHLLLASNTAPDVIFINNLYLPVYANADRLLDLSNYADTELYYVNALNALTWKNKLYAVPRDVSNLVIYYNKDIFDRYNAPYPSKNWTFDEFLSTAKKLTDRPDLYAISFEEDPLFFLPYLMSEGGGILSDDLQSEIIYNAESQKGLNFYSGLRKKYHIAPLKSESASATMAQMFLQGRLAMHLCGRWVVPKYREEAEFNWDIAEFPRGEAGSIVPLDASGWAVAKSSRHPHEAVKLVTYLASKQSSEKFTQSGLIVPARKDTANSEYFLDGKEPQNAKVFIDVIETSKPTPVSLNYKEITDKLSQKLEKKFN